jgi:hypothetical protein
MNYQLLLNCSKVHRANMALSKSNKLNSPHKQRMEEHNNKDKIETTPHIPPQTSKTSKTSTGFKERSIKSSTPREKYMCNPENIPYYDGDTSAPRIYRHDRNQHQSDKDGETINSTDDKVIQPLDKDAQGNIPPDEEIERKRMADIQQTPSKEDSKTAAQSETEESPISAEQPRIP